MSLLLVALMLALQTLPAPDSARWEEVNTDSAGRNAIDPPSLTRNGDIARFRLRVRYDDPAASRGVSVAISDILFDCRRRTYGIVAVDAYGSDGRLLLSRAVELSAVEYMPLVTLDNHEPIRIRVCGPDAA